MRLQSSMYTAFYAIQMQTRLLFVLVLGNVRIGPAMLC